MVGVKRLRSVEESWGDLARQGWALIAPEGENGDRLLEAIAPLCKLREEEQGAPVKVYRAPAGMSAKQAATWRARVFWPERTREADVPLYTLLLGEFDGLSVDLQQGLAASGTLAGCLEYGRVNDDLMCDYQLEEDELNDGRPSSVDPAERAYRWMLRNDLRGYVLLGDPAARLPLAR